MENFISKEEFRKRVVKSLSEDLEKSEQECEGYVKENEDVIDGEYWSYTYMPHWNQNKPNMTLEAYTKASVDAASNCISLFY